MTPEAIGKSYDRIAAQWNHPSFDRNYGIAAHQKALSFLKGNGWALDVGCGCSGRFFDLLLSAGFEVEGIDVSKEMVRLAKNRHPHIAIHHADISTWQFPRSYDFITAWDSLWHLPLSQQEAVLSKLCNGLRENGVLIQTIGGLEAPSETDNSHMGVPLAYSTLGIGGTLKALEQNGCICRHKEFDQAPETHLYLIAQKQTLC